MNEPQGTFGAGLGMNEPEAEKITKPKTAPKAASRTVEIDNPNWDRHAKSRAMFQAHQEAEARGESGTSAMFFAADKQRTLELNALKNAPPEAKAKSGAPVKAKSKAEIPLPPRRPQGTFGAGLGMNEPEEPSLKGLGGGETGMSDREVRSANMQNTSNNMQKEYDAKDRLAPIQDPMAEMVRKKEEAQRAGEAQDRQAVDDADMARAPGERATMAADQSKIEAIKSGESTPAQVRGSMRQAVQQIGPKPADLEPPPKNEDTGTGEPVVQNNNQTQNSGTTSGGEGNNVSGQNLPMKATNDWLKDFIERQQIAYQ
jgi:hypothetical protein